MAKNLNCDKNNIPYEPINQCFTSILALRKRKRKIVKSLFSYEKIRKFMAIVILNPDYLFTVHSCLPAGLTIHL